MTKFTFYFWTSKHVKKFVDLEVEVCENDLTFDHNDKLTSNKENLRNRRRIQSEFYKRSKLGYSHSAATTVKFHEKITLKY